MITTENIKKIVLEAIESTDYFLVDVQVLPGNNIMVEVDRPSGVNIKDCVDISRAIEGSYDRDIEDFEIEVSSPGLGQALKVPQQYAKYIGKEVEVLKQDGVKVKGLLTSFEDEIITLETSSKVKVEGKKKKQTVVTEHKLNINNDVKETSVVISFK